MASSQNQVRFLRKLATSDLAVNRLKLLILLFVFVVSTTAKMQAQSTAGGLDTSFGFSGWSSIAQFGQCTSMVIQPDGKILTAGFIEYQNNISTVTVARMLANGNPDTSFGTNGVTQTFFGPDSMNAGRNAANAIALQADGSIIVAGFYTPTGSSGSDFAIVRFTATGLRDSSFGVGGRVSTDFGGNDVAKAVAIQLDGKIVVAGGTALARYNTNGSLDTNFGTGGKVSLRINANALSVGQTGVITLAGVSQSNFALEARADNGGGIPSFGNNGVVITQFGQGIGEAKAIARQPDGQIVVAGWGYNNQDQFLQVARYAGDELATSFSDDGKLIITLSAGFNTQEEAHSVLIQPDGKIVLAGFAQRLNNSARNDFILVRLNRNGTFDTSFGNAGIVRANPCGNSSCGANTCGATDCGRNSFAAALQADRKIVVAGTGVRIDSFGSASNSFTVSRYLPGPTNSTKISDFDSDGKADISVFRPSNGVWYLLNSQSGFTSTQFGISTDRLTPADYDGDGKTDIAVYRDGIWYLLRSTQGFTAIQFGITEDIPQPADFDGDGKAELAVYRPSNGVWYVLNLMNGQFTSIQFGISEDKPVVGDYDGDGRADHAVYRPSSGVWYYQRSTAGFGAIQFGIATDKPVPADYDGDGKTDVAVYRPSNGVWYQQKSTDGFSSIQFGLDTDKPTPADYDGDGKADVAVFRPSNGVWYLQRSMLGFTGIQFGIAEDKPIPNAFVP